MSNLKNHAGIHPPEAKPLSRKTVGILVGGLILLLAGVYFFILPRAREIARESGEKTIATPELPEESTDWARTGLDYPHNTGAFVQATDLPRSRLPLEVEAGSYRQLPRTIRANRLPHPGTIKVDQLLNYFDYTYPQPTNGAPVGLSVDSMPCPWNAGNYLARIQLCAIPFTPQKRISRNLLFLIDLSRSMDGTGRLSLLAAAFRKFVDDLEPSDYISIVALASNSEILLPPTSGSNKELLRNTFENLRATRGSPTGEGFEIAYRLATSNFLTNYVNRIILCTDGDLDIDSIGTNSVNRTISEYAKNGITLSTLGFGLGNYQNIFMERLADFGRGTHEYINTYTDALRALHQELLGASPIVARNARLQVEFNSSRVSRYRLIGFENLALEPASARLQTSDMIGKQSLTALYEIILANAAAEQAFDPILTARLFYTPVQSDEQVILKAPLSLHDEVKASPDLHFAAGVATFAMLLQNSPHKGNATFDLVKALATHGNDGSPARAEFMDLVERASTITVAERF